MADTRSSGIHIRINPEIKASVEPIWAAIGLTENGYTPGFEAELLTASEEVHAAVADGSAKIYGDAAEMFADLDAEDDGSE